MALMVNGALNGVKCVTKQSLQNQLKHTGIAIEQK